MTFPKWYNKRHVVASTMKALRDQWATTVADFAGDEFVVTATPVVATTVTTPYEFPEDGDFYSRPQEDREHARALPWVEVANVSQAAMESTGLQDDLVRVMAVNVLLRVRVGMDAGTYAPAVAQSILDLQAEWLANAAAVCVMDGIGPAARALDATGAFGILWCELTDGPVGDYTALQKPETGRELISDARVTIRVYQRQYRSVGTA